MVLLEVKQSQLAREGLDVASTAILKLFQGIAEEGATAAALLEEWPPSRKPNGFALKRLLDLPLAKREELREAVKADLLFKDGFENPEYRFSFPGLDSTTKEPAEDLLTSIYKNVFCGGKGFEFGSGRYANRATWEADFRGENPDVEVCPACTASLLPPPVKRRSLVDADHYLPQTKYPALVVHGLNLVPMCKDCNQALKRDADPLATEEEACCLLDIWFPYIRAGLAEIQLTFDFSDRGLVIDFVGDDEAVARARRYDQIFELRERWRTPVTSLQERLPKKLNALGESRDAAGVRVGLDKLRKMAEGEEAQEVCALAKSRYYAWLQDEPKAFRTLVRKVEASTASPL